MVLNSVYVKTVLEELQISDRLTVKMNIEEVIELIRTDEYALLILEISHLNSLREQVYILRKIIGETSFVKLPKIVNLRQNNHKYRPLSKDELS